MYCLGSTHDTSIVSPCRLRYLHNTSSHLRDTITIIVNTSRLISSEKCYSYAGIHQVASAKSYWQYCPLVESIGNRLQCKDLNRLPPAESIARMWKCFNFTGEETKEIFSTVQYYSVAVIVLFIMIFGEPIMINCVYVLNSNWRLKYRDSIVLHVAILGNTLYRLSLKWYVLFKYCILTSVVIRIVSWNVTNTQH